MSFRFAITICACALLSGCFLLPYRIDVQQGNYIERETVAKLKPGMTRAQVRFVLGTPLIADPFNPNRWDYLYYNRPGRRVKDVRRLTIYFEDDKLKRAYADSAIAPTAAEMAAAAAAPMRPGAAPEPTGAEYPVVEPAQPAAAPKEPAPAKPAPSRSPVLPGRGLGTPQ